MRVHAQRHLFPLNRTAVYDSCAGHFMRNYSKSFESLNAPNNFQDAEAESEEAGSCAVPS